MTDLATSSTLSPVLSAVAKLLRPLVRVMLRHGVAFDQFAELAKEAYVDVAYHEFGIAGRKQTTSRVSVLTGLTRKEVVRWIEAPSALADEPPVPYNRAERVVTGWVQTFPLEGGGPAGARPLPLDGPESFAYLVKRFSGDMPVRSVLDELTRVGAVREQDGLLELLQRYYTPHSSDPLKVQYLGEDVADLINTIGHNLQADQSALRFQRRLFSDNIPIEYVAEFQVRVRQVAMEMIDTLTIDLTKLDRDDHPELPGTTRMRVAVGVYFAEEPFESYASPASARKKPVKSN
jgi:hypothetical protein